MVVLLWYGVYCVSDVDPFGVEVGIGVVGIVFVWWALLLCCTLGCLVSSIVVPSFLCIFVLLIGMFIVATTFLWGRAHNVFVTVCVTFDQSEGPEARGGPPRVPRTAS